MKRTLSVLTAAAVPLFLCATLVSAEGSSSSSSPASGASVSSERCAYNGARNREVLGTCQLKGGKITTKLDANSCPVLGCDGANWSAQGSAASMPMPPKQPYSPEMCKELRTKISQVSTGSPDMVRLLQYLKEQCGDKSASASSVSWSSPAISSGSPDVAVSCWKKAGVITCADGTAYPLKQLLPMNDMGKDLQKNVKDAIPGTVMPLKMMGASSTSAMMQPIDNATCEVQKKDNCYTRVCKQKGAVVSTTKSCFN